MTNQERWQLYTLIFDSGVAANYYNYAPGTLGYKMNEVFGNTTHTTTSRKP